LLPSLYVTRNELESLSCIEDLPCIVYLIIVSTGILYALYRFFTRGMSKKGRHDALSKFLFQQTKKN